MNTGAVTQGKSWRSVGVCGAVGRVRRRKSGSWNAHCDKANHRCGGDRPNDWESGGGGGEGQAKSNGQ